ncbi:MAG: glycosyltransferase [Clostridia bacterium]
MQKMSLIVPCYNEELSLQYFFDTVVEFYNDILSKKVDLELVFVNDGSKDNTWLHIKKLIKEKTNISIKAVNFSRNFGKESAIMAGLEVSTGDCVITIDADLQHPLETIPEMILKWNEGYKVVDGTKSSRGKESFLHKKFAGLFYNIISNAVGFNMKNASDFKLLDREVVDLLLTLKEKHVFYRGLTSWVGFPHTEVFFEVQEREFGETKWSFFKLTKYALNNISSFSTAPMLIVTYIGVLFLIFSGILGIYTLVSYFLGATVSGYATLTMLLLIIGSFNMIGLGIIGYYISKIFEQVQERPNYIIQKVVSNEVKKCQNS